MGSSWCDQPSIHPWTVFFIVKAVNSSNFGQINLLYCLIETHRMEDSNSIAFLSPRQPEDKDPHTWKAIRMNTTEYIPSRLSGYSSRESTTPLEDEKDQATSYPQLDLTFNSGLKSGHGLMFGTDPNSCDIVLPNRRYISRRHCYLTFDAERRLVLRDCSTYGNIIEYNYQGGELRRHFTSLALTEDQYSIALLAAENDHLNPLNPCSSPPVL